MRIAALLPTVSLIGLKRLVPGHEIALASSWRELDALIEQGVDVVVFDPTANGLSGIDDAARVLMKVSSAGVLAYVIPTPQNLRAVFRLSKLGLRYVFVHAAPRTAIGLLNAIDGVVGNRLSRNLLESLNTELAEMPAGLSAALADLFERPQRYQTAIDLAHEAAIPTRQLYRELSKAHLKAPKRLFVLAKAIQVYGYVRFSEYPEPFVRKKLGYSDRQCLARHVALVFGCRPGELCDAHRSDEELLALIRRIHGPTTFRQGSPGSKVSRRGKHLDSLTDLRSTKRHRLR
jgi:integrase